MVQLTDSSPASHRNYKAAILAVIFVLIAVAGLAYVKWWPYYGKAFKAAAEHSIGSSIISGSSETAPAPSWSAAVDYAAAYFKSVWKAAVLGILLGSLVQVLLPGQWLLKVLGKATFKSTAIGGIASLPAMMCTCCAAPIAVGLRKKDVSVGSSLAFWLGNPTINPATLIFMTFVLSWKFTLLRLIFGIALTFGVSYFANRFAEDAKVPDEVLSSVQENTQADNKPFLIRWVKNIGSMLLSIVPAYLIFVLILGAARAWLFPEIGISEGNHLLAIIGFAIAGMLFVIPTAAEIPIIQSFMSFGLGAGPAGALLLTLPAVSLPSLLMISRSYPRKVIAFVASSVVVLGILCGLSAMLIL
ncbi:permease [Paenibacillus caui]|uniref:permease n=1 Tax=Paenibacillus caui TaxID=2873927 RepID=UPI001CA8DB72|nr:permease [Paenibacillus caui]